MIYTRLKILLCRAHAIGALATALVGGVAACVPLDPDEGDGRMRVVATTGMIADAAARIAGEDAVVQGLMGPGIDPHLYKASEGDVRRLFRADVVLYNGLHLEAKMGEVLESMGDRARVVAVSDRVAREALLRPPEFEGAHDPHIWFDVRLWIDAVGAIGDAFVAEDPERADAYRARAAAYIEELTELDAYVRSQAARIPANQRVLVTAHDAFNYFGAAYGFEVRGLQGISTAAEAGTQDVQRLAMFVADRRIPALFLESSIPVRAIEAVRAAVRARGFEVRIGGELFSDALGDAGSPAGSYVGMIQHNIDTIVSGLTGEG